MESISERELVGFGMSDDAHHMTAPAEDGRGARAAMVNALKDAGLAVDEANMECTWDIDPTRRRGGITSH